MLNYRIIYNYAAVWNGLWPLFNTLPVYYPDSTYTVYNISCDRRIPVDYVPFNELNRQTTVTRFYSRGKLFQIRWQSAVKLSSDKISILKQLNIFKFRGHSSGNYRRSDMKIPVQIGKRFHSIFSRPVRPRQLTPVSKDSSFNISSHESYLRLGCINACSINNKVTAVKSLIKDHSLN